MTTLSLEKASAIVDAALLAGRGASMMPLTVAVLDAGGHLLAFKREDGSGILRPQIAMGKAWGALGMGISSRLMRDRLSNRPTFITALTAAADGRLIPVPGGVLIKTAEGGTIGSVGISGDTSEKDEYCAVEGVKAAGLVPDPPEPDPNWQESNL
ncbi:MAG: heme-binding protein [Alphaproteobacteria bacterium]|nr:heme-binding protein [Alphaproteobacteria bacterium]